MTWLIAVFFRCPGMHVANYHATRPVGVMQAAS